MKITHIHCADSFDKISKLLDETDSVAINPSFVYSLEQLKLANHLAEKSFKNKNNISKHLRYEFLLWLSSKRDISSAFSTTMSSGCDYLVICFGKKTPIFGTKKALTLKKEANPLDLEKISLSRLL